MRASGVKNCERFGVSPRCLLQRTKDERTARKLAGWKRGLCAIRQFFECRASSEDSFAPLVATPSIYPASVEALRLQLKLHLFMRRLEPTAQSRGIGLDLDDSALVLPFKRNFSMYLIGGPDVKPTVKDPDIVELTEQTPGKGANPHLSKDESGAVVRQLNLKSLRLGNTILSFAGPDGKAALQWMDVSVVQNADARQAEDARHISASFREELQSLTFRDALIRVATDQMYSAIGRSGSANARYDDGGEWCGSFVRWCYEVVSAAKGVENPFAKYSLRSGIKTLYAGMAEPTKFTVMRYEGPDRYGGLKTQQKFIEIDDSHPVRMGDICLPRGDSGDTFPHVSMVYDESVTGGAFSTIDGNQTGAYNPGKGYSPYCIGINDHNADDKIKVEGKLVPKYAFIHVSDDLIGT